MSQEYNYGHSINIINEYLNFKLLSCDWLCNKICSIHSITCQVKLISFKSTNSNIFVGLEIFNIIFNYYENMYKLKKCYKNTCKVFKQLYQTPPNHQNIGIHNLDSKIDHQAKPPKTNQIVRFCQMGWVFVFLSTQVLEHLLSQQKIRKDVTEDEENHIAQ